MSSIPGGDIVSTVGNGGLMTKKELLAYFLMCVRLQTDYEELETKICEKRQRIDELRLLMKSRDIYIEQKAKPFGIGAIFDRSWQRQYNDWCAASERRKKSYSREKEADEIRIAGIASSIKALEDEVSENVRLCEEIKQKYNEVLQSNVVSREYTDSAVLLMLSKYMYDNRASTLTEAINLYHQEMHWKRLEKIEEQKRLDAAAAQRRMEERQAEGLASIAQAQRYSAMQTREMLGEIKRSADDAKFYSELSFWMNL